MNQDSMVIEHDVAQILKYFAMRFIYLTFSLLIGLSITNLKVFHILFNDINYA